MMQCPKCGYNNQDDSMFCTGCGTPLTSAPTDPIPQESKPKRRGLMIAILCIVLVAAIGIGAAVWMTHSQPDDHLMAAIEKTNQAMGDLYAKNKNLAAIGDNFKKLTESNSLTMLMEINDGHDMMNFQIHTQKNAGLFNMTYNLMGTSMDINIYADPSQIQFSVPGYLDEVLGMPTENLEENLKNSWIGQNMDIDIPENFEQSLNMTSPYQKELDAITNSIVVEELPSVELALGDATHKCDAYQVNFDPEAVIALFNAAYAQNAVTSSAASMLPYDDSELQEIMEELDEFDTTMYVDDRGYWVGMDIMHDGDGAELRFEGTDNICQTIAFSMVSQGDKATMNFISNVTEDEMEIVLESVLDAERLTFLHYDNNGNLTLVPELAKGVQFQLLPTDGGIELTFAEEDTDAHFTMALYPLQEKVAPLADTYTNLLEMDENDFMKLIASAYGG